MATRPAFIMPALPFASQADTGRALSVMPLIISEDARSCQTARLRRPIGAGTEHSAQPDGPRGHLVVDGRVCAAGRICCRFRHNSCTAPAAVIIVCVEAFRRSASMPAIRRVMMTMES